MNGSTTVNHPTSLMGCKFDNLIIMQDLKFVSGDGCTFIIIVITFLLFFATRSLLLILELPAKFFDVTFLLAMMAFDICISVGP